MIKINWIFFEKSRFDHWQFKNLDWSPPQMISVPALSTKERMTLDAALPVSKELNAGDHLVSTLGYCPSEVGGGGKRKSFYWQIMRCFIARIHCSHA